MQKLVKAYLSLFVVLVGSVLVLEDNKLNAALTSVINSEISYANEEEFELEKIYEFDVLNKMVASGFVDLITNIEEAESREHLIPGDKIEEFLKINFKDELDLNFTGESALALEVKGIDQKEIKNFEVLVNEQEIKSNYYLKEVEQSLLMIITIGQDQKLKKVRSITVNLGSNKLLGSGKIIQSKLLGWFLEDNFNNVEDQVRAAEVNKKRVVSVKKGLN